MSKPLKIALIAVGGLVGLFVVAAIAISLTFDPNDYKDLITSQVKSRTGRTLTLEGDLSLSFFPWLGVQSGKASLGNAAGFGEQPFASLDHVNVHVRLLPLLQKRLEVGTVTLEGLRVNLVRNAQGHGNWEDLLASEPAATPAAGSDSSPIASIAIAGLELRDASLSWRDDQAKSEYLIDEVALTTGALAPGEPIDVELALTVAKGLPDYGADLKLAGTVRADLENSHYDVDGMKLAYTLRDAKQTELASGTITGKLAADVEQSVYALDGVALKGKLPPLAAGAQPMDIEAGWSSARLDEHTQALAVTGVKLRALDLDVAISKLEGTQMVDDPTVKGSLQLPKAPLSKLLSAAGITVPGVDPKALGDASLRGDFTVKPSAGSMAFSGLDAELLGMRIQGDARSAGDKLSGNLRVPQFATAQLFRAFASALPADIDVKAIDKLALSAAFEMDSKKGTLALQGLKAELLDTTLAAEVLGSSLDKQAHYTGSVHVDKVAPGRFIAVFGKLMPAGLDAKELGPLALDTRFDWKTAQQQLQLDALHMTLVGLNFGGNLTLSKFPDATEYAGELSVDRFSPRAMLQRFGAEVPVTADPKVLTAAAGKARLAATSKVGRFENVDLTLDDSHITGSFAVNDFDNPAYDFALTIDSVDVDRYLPPPEPEDKKAKPSAATGDVEIPVEALKSLKIGGTVKAAKMKMGGLRLEQFNARLSAKDGLASLDPVTASLYRGTFKGGFTADARAATPAMTIKGEARNIGVGMFLQDLSAEPPSLTGAGSFTLNLSGKGDSYKKNLASADGSVGFKLQKGALKGFDLGYTLCTAYNALRQLPKPKVKDTGKTPFESISGTATVKNGIATTSDILGTTSFMKVTGKGSMNLPAQTLDYDMTGAMTTPSKLAGCAEMDKALTGESFPLTIKGTVSEPKVRPDYGKFATEQLKNRLEDKLKDKLLDKLGGKKKDDSNP